MAESASPALVLELDIVRKPLGNLRACMRGWPHTLPGWPNFRNPHWYLCRAVVVAKALVLELDIVRKPLGNVRACMRGWPHTLRGWPNIRNPHWYLCRAVVVAKVVAKVVA